jgi:hypothetical protein
MSRTVGLTTAIATRLILDGSIKLKGVLSPIYKEIYEPVLKELEKLGIVMHEESNRIMRPKL